MKENKYDEDKFFEKYKQMPRSAKGLEAAGEWHLFRKMMPELKGKRVLDLGCGFAGIVDMQWTKGSSFFQWNILSLR